MTALTTNPRHRRAGLLLAVTAAALAAPRVLAQDAKPAGGQGVQITVRQTQAQTQAQTINVALNQGALVDFSVPVSEVRIANPAIADVTVTSPRQILVTGKSFGNTQLIATVDGGQQQIFTVAVDVDLQRLQAAIRSIAPRAKVQATAMLDSIVLSGTVPDTDSAERVLRLANVYSQQVVNQLKVAGVYQVLLRCTVAEVNRQATRRLGFNGWMAGENFKDMFALSNIAGINPSNIGAAGAYLASNRIPFATAQDGIPVGAAPTLSVGFPNIQMQIFIQALRENGLLKVLAEPNLVTISGQEANFLAGGEFPVPVPQGGNNNAITVEFREFGVRLRFTPTVLSDDVIRLQVTPEVSEPDYSTAIMIGGYAVPGLAQRRVDTVVELGPGTTFAIGGLLSERTRATSSKIPALGEVPVIGALFASTSYQTSETELVILVTPELVSPLTPDQITYLPGLAKLAPNDWELFGMGQLEGGDAAPAGQTEGVPPAPAPARKPAGNAALLPLRGPVGPAGGAEGL
jgi:pilus assembly protein CpaC